MVNATEVVDLSPIYDMFIGSGERILPEIRLACLQMSGAFLCHQQKSPPQIRAGLRRGPRQRQSLRTQLQSTARRQFLQYGEIMPPLLSHLQGQSS